jgi:hypothetical protein
MEKKNIQESVEYLIKNVKDSQSKVHVQNMLQMH